MPRRDDIDIRAMEEEDLADVADLENLVFSHPWSLEDFMAEQGVPQTFCRILIEKSRKNLLAYLCCRRVTDGIEILKIAVRPDRQHRGLASLLMDTLHDWAKQSESPALFLEVASSNDAALAFYRKQGFKSTGIRKRYYPGGIDAINMMKNLMENFTDKTP